MGVAGPETADAPPARALRPPDDRPGDLLALWRRHRRRRGDAARRAWRRASGGDEGDRKNAGSGATGQRGRFKRTCAPSRDAALKRTGVLAAGRSAGEGRRFSSASSPLSCSDAFQGDAWRSGETTASRASVRFKRARSGAIDSARAGNETHTADAERSAASNETRTKELVFGIIAVPRFGVAPRSE